MTQIPPLRSPSRPVSAAAPTALYWLPTATFILHTLEELPDFPAWVSRHFADMALLEFAAIHIPLLWLVTWISYRAQADGAAPTWRFLAYALQWQFAFNALFHLGAAAVFQDYSPGMVTAATVALPGTLLMASRYRRDAILSPRRTWAAVGLGGLIAASAIAVLFV